MIGMRFAGANDNIDHKAGGGTTKVFDEKQDYSDVKSKAGNFGDTWLSLQPTYCFCGYEPWRSCMNTKFNEMIFFSGANDNIKHKAAGGEKKVFDQKVVYK